MKCIITRKETSNTYKGQPVAKIVVDFAKFYRDRLNDQQKQKMKVIMSQGKKIISKRHFVTTTATIDAFKQMSAKREWENILITLTDELVLKGLLDENIQEITIEKYN